MNSVNSKLIYLPPSNFEHHSKLGSLIVNFILIIHQKGSHFVPSSEQMKTLRNEVFSFAP